jgi:hypothetical protein
MFWDAAIEKERRNKKQLFLKCLSTKDNNDKVQYKKAQAKIRRMVANYRNKFWVRKCLEIHILTVPSSSLVGSHKTSFSGINVGELMGRRKQ